MAENSSNRRVASELSRFGWCIEKIRTRLTSVLCGTLVQCFAVAMVAAGSPQFASPAAAAEPAWPSGAYKYSVVEQELAVVLQELGRNTGLRVEVGAEVHGRVRGPLPSLTPREFLDYLCANYGLEWYFDGFRLYVSTGKESVSRVISRGAVPLDRLNAAMRELAISDDRFPLREVKQSDLLLVSGPPQYAALVDRTLAALKAAAHPRVGQPPFVTIYRADQVATVKLAGSDDGSP
ncbi:nodulation protein NolW [Bradyrhizobium oligotrophicum]|uniref:nodulation protein NolW n=1 Tax=Bradyrhizobium oligotrophicum TaxID=44255 RepID=UPI003EBA5604